VTLNQPGPHGASVGFAERLLEVIDSGRRTATYKLALLITLLELCSRHSDTSGRAPGVLYTRDIAEQVAVLYWPQVIPYLVPGASTAVELRQVTLPRAAIIAAVSAFRGTAATAGTTSWHLARQRLPGAYQAMGPGRGHRRRTAPAPAAGGRLQRQRLPVPLRTQLGTARVFLPGAAAPPRPPGPRYPAAARRRR
jgi:hypothetical protein